MNSNTLNARRSGLETSDPHENLANSRVSMEATRAGLVVNKKRCTKCHQYKTEAGFYEMAATKDGLRPDCKSCRKAATRKYHQTEQGQASRRRYKQNKNRPVVARRARQRHRRKYPLATFVYVRVARAIRTGEITRPAHCEQCLMPHKYIYAHHENYSKPLEIVWLCSPCHRRIQPKTVIA